MTTIYRFKVGYTKYGVGTNPSVAPTITVVDTSNNILVNAQATTNLSNIPGTYIYSYSGADKLDLVGVFRTSDVTMDAQDIYSYTPTLSLVNDIWDEVLTGATHNVASSAGRRLRQITASVVFEGIAVGPGTNGNQIVLDAAASSVDGSYDPSLIAIVNGTGAGQCRLVLDYVGSTRTATVDRTWKVNPAADSEYVIYANPGREHVNEGLAQGGTINTITLNASASAFNNNYNGQLVFIRSGTGEDQVAAVTSYNGTTKVATVNHNWDVIPNTTSGYVMLPSATASIDVASIWAYPSRTLTMTANTIVSIVSGTTLRVRRGDTWIIPITGMGSLVGRTKLYFTVKKNVSIEDVNSSLQVEETAGLLYSNGSVAIDPADGTLTVNDAALGNVTIVIKDNETAKLSPGNYLYDIQVLDASGDAFTLTSGDLIIDGDITRIT